MRTILIIFTDSLLEFTVNQHLFTMTVCYGLPEMNWYGATTGNFCTKLNPNPYCYYNHTTRNSSLHKIFAIMSETLLNFMKFFSEQIKVDFQYLVRHWPDTYCSNGSWSFFRILSSTNMFKFLMATLFSSYNIDIDFLNPVVHLNWKSIFERKTKLLWLLIKLNPVRKMWIFLWLCY